MRHILKCSRCKTYTLKETCECGQKTSANYPLKYSPDDRMSGYRRQAKLEDYRQRGLI